MCFISCNRLSYQAHVNSYNNNSITRDINQTGYFNFAIPLYQSNEYYNYTGTTPTPTPSQWINYQPTPTIMPAASIPYPTPMPHPTHMTNITQHTYYNYN